jgi:hypothetical protein
MSAAAIYCRLTPEMISAVRAAAAAEKISAAGWLRRTAAVALGQSIECLPPSPWRRPVPPEDVAEMARLVGAVGRATGATIQLARALRETGAEAQHAEAELVLSGLRAAQRELVAASGRMA